MKNDLLEHKKYKNAVVMPIVKCDGHNFMGGVYCDGSYIPESHLYLRAPYLEPQNKISTRAIYAGMLFGHYGHFLLESLARIWYIKQHPEISIVWTQAIPYNNWQKEILDILDVHNDTIHVKTPTQFDSLIVPFSGFAYKKQFFSSTLKDALAVYPAQTPQKGKYSYISRSKLSDDYGGFDNEIELETILLKRGWSIFHPQEHSIKRQLDEMSGSEIILGVECSAFHALVLLNNMQSNIFALTKSLSNTQAYHLIASVSNFKYNTLNFNAQLTKKGHIPSRSRYNLPIEKMVRCLDMTNDLTEDTNKLNQFIVTNNTNSISSKDIKQIISQVKVANDAQLFYYFAKIYQTYDAKLAEDAYKKALGCDAFDGSMTAEYCKFCIKTNNFEHIIDLMQRAITKQSHLSFSLRTTLAELCRKKGNFDIAEQIVREALVVHPNKGGLYHQLSNIFYSRGQREEAIKYAYKALTVEPSNLSLRTHLSNLLRWTYLFDDAIELMHDTVTVNPSWGESYRQLAYVARDKSNVDEAIQLALQSIEAQPKNLNYSELLVILLLKKFDLPAAETVLQNTISINPELAWTYVQMSQIYSLRGNLDKAIEYAHMAVTTEPGNIVRRSHLCGFMRKIGDFDAAIKLMATSAQLDPYSSEPHVQFSLIHDAKGELDEAIACARKATEVEPYNLQRKAHLSNMLRKKGDFDTAIEVMTVAMELNPYWSEPHFQFSLIHDSKGELDEAITCARKAATEVEPHNLQRKAHLTNLLRKKGDFDAAIEVMTAAMELNPYWSEPHAQFSYIHDAKGELDEAIACARKATKVEPYNLGRKAHLATLLRKQKLFDEATQCILQGLNFLPGWGDGYIHLSHAYMGNGYLALAIEAAQKAMSVTPLPPAHWNKHLTNLITKRESMASPSTSPVVARINAYAQRFECSSYLEIGVCKGATFNSVTMPHKTAVDPNFQFDTRQYTNATTIFCSTTSDNFFQKFKTDSQSAPYGSQEQPFKFDIIFIDGLHTYEQALRDFENSLAYSHEKTIWIFDDTCPSNCFSAMDSASKRSLWKAVAGLSKDGAWHGDVFKVIFAIHDKYPEFSYCTQVNRGNPQTILWRTETPAIRKKAFLTYESIALMRYEDFVENAWVLYPVNDDEVIDKIYTHIEPGQYKTGEEFKKVVKRIVTDNERQYSQEIIELKDRIKELEKGAPVAPVVQQPPKQDYFTNTKDSFKDFKIGDFTYGSPQISFWDKSTCSIGKFCSIADGVGLTGGGEHRTDCVTSYPFNALSQYFPFAKGITGHPKTKGPVQIGNDVWIGTDACILSGVTVGDGAVIGARSLVAKDVPPYAVVAGNPAKIVKFRFSKQQIQKLLKIQWWNWDLAKIEKHINTLLDSNITHFISAVESESEEIQVDMDISIRTDTIHPPLNITSIVSEEIWNLHATPATILGLKESECFDEEYYTRCYPETGASGLRPVEHYVLHGAAQGKNPSPLFDTLAYLETYPDVAEGGVNPFWHYLRYGYAEGRKNIPVVRNETDRDSA